MKAWYISRPGKIDYRDMPLPPQPADEEVSLKIISVCICNGSDPGIVEGFAGYPFPMLFGHEACGIVIKKGKNVTDFQVGDRVCWWCTIGVFAEYINIRPGDVAMYVVPDNVTDKEAPVLELILASSRALMRYSEGAKGKKLAILGMGPSGQVALQWARHLGFSEIHCLDLYEKRRALARKLGADLVIDPSSPDFVAEMAAMPQVDVALDMMGDELIAGQRTIDRLIERIKVDGELVSYEHPDHGRLFSPAIFQGKRICMTGPENDIAVIKEKGYQVMQAVRDGVIRVTPLISHVYRFEQLLEVYTAMQEKPEDYMKSVFLL